MCFYVDYDWCAEISEESEKPAEKPTKCDECHGTIPVGGIVRHIYQQEHEECYACVEGECECPKDKDDDCIGGCQCAEPAYGETFDYDCCEECHKFLKAVYDAEIEAGCPPSEAQPYLGGMVEAIQDGGMDEAKKYWKTAAKEYPELVTQGGEGWLNPGHRGRSG